MKRLGTMALVVSLLALVPVAAQAQACVYPVTIQVNQSDASGNTTLPGTSGCAMRVVKATSEASGAVEVLRCAAPDGTPDLNNPVVAVEVAQIVSAFGVHNPNGGIERWFCASQLRGK